MSVEVELTAASEYDQLAADENQRFNVSVHIAAGALDVSGSRHGELLDHVSEPGGGRYHCIADPSVGEFEFSSALGAQQAIVAVDVEVILAPADGVRIVNVPGKSRTELSSRGIHVRMADIPAETRRKLVAELELKAGREKGPRPLLEVILDYEDVITEEREELVAALEVTLARDTGEPNVDVMHDTLVAEVEAVREGVPELVERGYGTAVAAGLMGMMERIEQAPGFERDDDSMLAEAFEWLHGEWERLDKGRHQQSFEFIGHNRNGTFDSDVNDKSDSLSGDPTDSSRKLVLNFVAGPLAGQRVAIQGEVMLGRAALADIPTGDQCMAQRHVQVISSDDKHILRDCGSTNGTFLNGDRVYGSTPLKDGDRIYVGNTEIEVEEGG